MSRSIILAAVLFLSTSPAHALVVSTESDGDWDVTTDFVGSLNDNLALVMSQPWWEDRGLATEFAKLVRDELGVPNFDGEYGPYFPYEFQGSTAALAAAWDAEDREAINRTAVTTSGDFTDKIAVAVFVPEPAAEIVVRGALLAMLVVGRARASK